MQNLLKFSLSVFLLTLSSSMAYFMLTGGFVRAAEPQRLAAEGTYQYQLETTLRNDGKFRFEVLVWNTATGESAWYYFDTSQYQWLKEEKQIPPVEF